MILTSASHVDHGINEKQLGYLASHFAERTAFFIETITLPAELGTVPCGLVGPIMGDEPVRAGIIRRRRGSRQYVSRCILGKPRQVSTVTVIAGPHGDDPCMLYTAFGGPLSPKETGDPTLTDEDRPASRSFWSKHGLVTDRAPITDAEIEVLRLEALAKDDGALESTCVLAMGHLRGMDITEEEAEEYRFELAEVLIARRALDAAERVKESA